MDRQRGARTVYACGVLWGPPDRCLIVRATSAGPWEFPAAAVAAATTAEETLRRVCATRLGVQLGEIIGQGELVHDAAGRPAAYRYYVCPLPRDEVLPLGYAEVRWVALGELGEYAFSPVAALVAERLRGEVR
jgi:hypothetical protein